MRRCLDQIEVQVNLPWAYFNLGELYLLGGKTYKCLNAYAKAIMCSDRAFMIQGAFDSLTHRPGTLSPDAQRRILGVPRTPTNAPVPPAQMPVVAPVAQQPGVIPAKMLADPFGDVNMQTPMRAPFANTSLGNSDPAFPIAPTPPGRAITCAPIHRRPRRRHIYD